MAKFSGRSIPIGRPTKGEFRTLIKTRNKKMPYFRWRREIGLACIGVYFHTNLILAIDRMNQRLAMKEGHLRFQFKNFLINVMRRAVLERPFRVEFTISDAEITAVSTGRAEHLKYHTRGHPEFNEDYITGYEKPTTANTHPLDRRAYVFELPPVVIQQYHDEFARRGLIL